MRETLIQILPALPVGSEKTIDAILAVLRCDTCAHWDNFCPEVEAGSCDEVDRLTRPDFFCARWEGR